MDQPFDQPAAFDWKRAKLTHRGCLPHVQQDQALYFVTFRLGDSIPVALHNELINRRDAWLKMNPQPHTTQQIQEYRQIWTVRIENLLDNGIGCCVLRNPDCRTILEETLRQKDGETYRLGEYVIMPNHVHVLIYVSPENKLSDIIRTWKSISSHRINKITGRSGMLWMREYFDHAVRSESDLERFTKYIQKNPQRLIPNEFTLGKGKLNISTPKSK